MNDNNQNLLPGDEEAGAGTKGELADYSEALDGEKEKRRASGGAPEPGGRPPENRNGKEEDGGKKEGGKFSLANIRSLKDLKGLASGLLRKGPAAGTSREVIKTNLMQGEATAYFDWKEHSNEIFSALFYSVLFILFLYGGLLFWEERTINKGEALVNDARSLIADIKEAELAAEAVELFEKKLSLVNYLLDRHIHWSNIFEFFEKNTLGNVFITNGLNGKNDGMFEVSLAVDNYRDITDQMTAWRNNEFVLEMNPSEAEKAIRYIFPDEEGAAIRTETEVSVDFSIKLDPAIYLESNK